VKEIPVYERPRIPGVSYKPETRYREETTVIDGKPSTRQVEYTVMVPQPERDWYRVIIRGVTGLALGITGLAVIGTTASVGGELSEILHPVVAYGVGVVFTATWLACLGLEWALSQTDPDRAKLPRIGGWVALVISMAAVFSYGHDHGQDVAGGVGACLDLLAKGLWALLIYAQDVPLEAGVAHWVRDQRQEAAARGRLARQIARLNSMQAYQQAVGGREYQAAQAILTVPAPVPALADTSGQAPAVSGQTPAQAAVPVSGQVPDPSGPPPSAPTPPPAASTPAPSAPTPPPAASVSPPAAPVPPVPPVTPAATGASGSSEQGGEEEQPGEQGATGTPPNLQPVGPLSIAAAVRQARTEDPEQTDAQMVARVLMLRGGDDNGDRAKFTSTVIRTRHRQENPPARGKKRNRSA
jgi:hypothetical protein